MSSVFRPARTLAAIAPPATLTIGAKVAEMAAAGRDVISMSMGEPDFPPLEHVKEAAIKAIRDNASRYTPIAGTKAVREAVSHKFATENGLTYAPEQVILGTGGKQIVSDAFLATLDPGDEVVIPVPSWVSYPDMVTAFGGQPVLLTTPQEDGFKVTPQALERAITARTRWVVLNSPSNPCGAVYSRADYEALAEVLRRHPHVWVLTDEIYEHLVYGEAEFVSFPAAVPDLADRTLVMNGLSKAYAMPGWRIGYGVGPRALIDTMVKAQGQQTSATSVISQAATVAALMGPKDELATRRAIFERRRDAIFGAISAVEQLSVTRPDGAFYLYPSVAKLIGGKSAGGRVLATDEDVALALLEEEGVGVVHGAAFGHGPHIRLSFAGDDAMLAEACRRVARFCAACTAPVGAA